MLNKNDDVKMRKTVIDGKEVFEVVINGAISYYKSFDELPEDIKKAMQITLRNNLVAKKLVVEVIYRNKNFITINEKGKKQRFKNIEHVPEFYKKLIFDTFDKKKTAEEKESAVEKYNNLLKINNERDVYNEYIFPDKVVMVALVLNPIWKTYFSVGIGIILIILIILMIIATLAELKII